MHHSAAGKTQDGVKGVQSDEKQIDEEEEEEEEEEELSEELEDGSVVVRAFEAAHQDLMDG
jgi:hypothetical protein